MERVTNLEVSSLDLERDYHVAFDLVFFTLVFEYNSLDLQLAICETIFLLDIIINFFVIRNEDVEKRDKPITSVSVTASSYYNQGFWFDFIIWFPWYAILKNVISGDLHVFNVIKCFRLVVLNNYLGDKQLKQKCGTVFDYFFKAVLDDPKKSQDFRENRTFIEKRILANNIAIAIKILFYTILTLYFTGAYWLCFSLIFFAWNDFQNVESFFIETFLALDIGDKILQSFYFALTTLSTVGFGDFYPKSNSERLLGALIILFGVALFSIIISEFLDMISGIQSVLKQETDDD